MRFSKVVGTLATVSIFLMSIITSAAAESAQTTPNKYVEAGDIRFAYRSFGTDTGVPLVLLPHSRGNMENWDPIFLDRLALTRRVILFDNVGVGLTGGEMTTTFTDTARYAAKFIRAINLDKVDLLGFSIGGCAAQELAANDPSLVRKLILAGTAPRGGEGLNTRPKDIVDVVQAPPSKEGFLKIFFAASEASQKAGLAYFERMQARKVDRSPYMTNASSRAQAIARDAWGAEQDASFNHLSKIEQPTLIANGNADIMMPTVNSWNMYQHMKNAQLILYPDSAHGFLFQYPEAFADDVIHFLDR
jgi:pimeloyl-ACP methyl ester carboxylesterase